MTTRTRSVQGARTNKSQGFSLVEAIVAGAITIGVLLTLTALFIMNSRQVSGSFGRSLTNLQYQTVVEQIGANIQRALIVSSSRSPVIDASGNAISSDSLFLFDSTAGSAGTFFSAYRRIDTLLMEWNGTQFINFKVGNKNIKVLNTGSSNTFTIAPDRRGVVLNLSVYGRNGSSSDTSYSSREAFKCRHY